MGANLGCSDSNPDGLRLPLELRVPKAALDGIAAEVLRTKRGPLHLFGEAGRVLSVAERMTIKETKRAMRREVIARVLALSAADRTNQERGLLEGFGQLPGWQQARTVLLYAAAFREEIDTRPLMQLAIEAGKRLVLPVVNLKAKRLNLVEVGDPERELEVAGRFSIPEPMSQGRAVRVSEIDWILVPGVAFDSTGGRLGRGGGFYDRLLAGVSAGVSVWSVLYEEQWVERVPMELHDCRVGGLLSCTRLVETRLVK